jgi:predicted phage-related endonuclease
VLESHPASGGRIMTVERAVIDTSTEAGRAAWLVRRKAYLNGSTIGALFGVHNFQTIAGLHAEKCGLELPGPDPESSVIRRGNALETVVAAEVGKLRPEWQIVKANEFLYDEKNRLAVTPDFWIHGDPRGLGVLQTKTVGSYKFKREWRGETGDEPTAPLAIVLQNAVEMMLADAAFGAIGVLVIGDYQFDCHLIEIPRHKDAEHKIRVAVNMLWQALEAGQVPTIDYDRDGDLVRLMYPREVEGKVIDLRMDNRIVELCEIRERNAAMIAVAEKAKKAAETEMREKLGDAEIGIVNGWKVSLRTTEFDQEPKPAKHVSYRVLRTVREREQ